MLLTNKIYQKFFLIAFIIIFGFFQNAQISLASKENQLLYRGYLKNIAGKPITGVRNITLKIYDSPSEGNMVWEQFYPNTNINNGFFSVYMGNSENNISSIDFSNNDYYVGLKVEDTELSQRMRINDSAFSFYAKNISDGAINSPLKILDGIITGTKLATDIIIQTTQTITANIIKALSSIILEDPGIGENTITIKAPENLNENLTIILPNTTGSNGSILTSTSSGSTSLLSWLNPINAPFISRVGSYESQIIYGGDINSPNGNLVLRSTLNEEKGQVIIDETTESTSKTTGSLVINGGVGIGKNLNIGNDFSIDDGNDNYKIEQISGITTNATATNIAVLEVPNNSVVLYQMRLTAYGVSNTTQTFSSSAVYSYLIRAKKVNGVLTIGAVGADYASEEITAWAAVFAISNNNLAIRVTGDATNTIKWKGTIISQVNNGT